MDSKPQRTERLECPAVPPLEQKLANLTRRRPAIGPAPRSSVLDKLATFLPQMADENVRLEQEMRDRPAGDFDLEQIDDDDEGPYVEMNLSCGILELRDEAALRAAERAMAGRGGAFGLGEDNSSSEDDSSDEETDDDSYQEEQDVSCRKNIPQVAEDNSPGGRAVDDVMEDGKGEGGEDDAGAPLVENGGGTVTLGNVSTTKGRRKVATKRSKMIEELS